MKTKSKVIIKAYKEDEDIHINTKFTGDPSILLNAISDGLCELALDYDVELNVIKKNLTEIYKLAKKERNEK